MFLGFAVEVKALVKQFGNICALDELSFNVEKGEIYGLIGPNGAGKTTTLRTISTLIMPTSGSVEIFGLETVAQAAEVRKIISYLPEEAGAYPNLSGNEYLTFMAKFNTKNQSELRETVKEAAGISGLEPASGLDVLHAYHVREIIKTYVKQHEVTVLLSSHNMLEVEYLCDRVALLNKGKIVVEGKPEELLKRYESENLEEVFAKVVGYA
jgi:ABC-2 type transport system ATP-binding protein